VVEKLNYWRQHSSNARLYPPGILEWKEGNRILSYVAQQLALSAAERDKLLLDFFARCSEWSGNGVQPHELFSDAEHEFWFWMNTEGRRLNTRLGQLLPGMPDETIQRNFTGAAGDITLREAFEFYAFVKQYMQEHGKLLASCENVLDFGCGWGRIIRFFLKDLEGSRLWGVDCYAAAVESARQTNYWCRFEQIDPMPPVSLSDSMFDLIYCFSVFSHLSEEAHERWLVEFHRLLKPGGMLFATTRGRDFIEYCARLRDQQRKQGLQPFLLGPAQSFLDTERCLADYDNGKFCYSAVGGGGILDKSFFGEAVIPKAYVLDRWTKHFKFMDYVSNRTLCPQDIIVVEKVVGGKVNRSRCAFGD
jgi:SAM-dependent methyltransferase